MKAKMMLMSALVMAGCTATQQPAQPAKATNLTPAPVAVAPTPKFALPEYQVRTLDNGLTVYLMERHQVPLITVNAVVRAGAVNDSEPGLAALTAESLLLGTSKMKKAELEALVDGLGASLTAGAGKEGTTVNARFLAKDTDTMLDLVADVLQHPSFPSDEVKKARDRYVAMLAQQKESPRTVIRQYFDMLYYGDHPYANTTVGDGARLSQLDAFDLRMFHGSWFQPRNAAIVVAGDFDADAMARAIEQRFGTWRDGDTPTAPKLNQPVKVPQQARVLLVDKPDARETTFLIGGPGVARDNPDYVGLQVINTILGGRFTSWLNDELRVNAGLTYGARSGFTSYGEAGSFQISTFTATETTQEAIDLALKTYQRLWQQGIDEATLASAKAYVKGQFPPRYETSGQLAGLLGQMYLYDLSDAQVNAFQQQVDALTLEQAQALVAKYFPKADLQFVLVGQADAIRGVAAQYGEVAEVAISDHGFWF
ncbi:M16 family metallopeptidase [Ferrimonas balearica]|uniref:M16 family metallopeptidase n=1 Tax=Ferrimonas balearica TaxID=44012 RepID=UPI001C57CDCB|nr:pitrilysin family protein [Ferrimonas balearica]MBW3141297.1 insulinase family protein [Ferrimonas balearica]MBY6108338.1 insulinase family protein [Ferrimonas balearica]MBY6225538.1 insulinase family protein [Ferrimonas balearica]